MIHHDDAVRTLIERERLDPRTLAIILTGSVASGTERVDSDIDVYLVVTEEAFRTARRINRVMFTTTEGIGYEGGYFDVKLASLRYLDAAAERGDDPTRASFGSSRVVWSRIDGIEERIARIGRPDPAAWRSHEESFFAQARLHGEYFLPGALRDGDHFLAASAAIHLANAACRVMLARHRVLFRGPKYLISTVARLDDVPEGFLAAVDALVRSPDVSAADRLLRLLEVGAAPIGPEDSLSRFVQDNELAWLDRGLPPEYR